MRCPLPRLIPPFGPLQLVQSDDSEKWDNARKALRRTLFLQLLLFWLGVIMVLLASSATIGGLSPPP